MKKLFKILFVLLIMCTLVACGDEPIPVDESVKVNSISISNPLDKIEIGTSDDLDCEILPANATIKDVVWSSSDSNVLTVDNEGKINAVGIGKAKISVITTDGTNLKDEIEIEVYEVKIPELIVSDSLELYLGEEKLIEARLENYDSDIIFESKNPTICQIEGNLLKGLKAGTATITVKAGSLSKNITVVVLPNELVISGPTSLVEGDVQEYKLLVNGKEVEASWISNEVNVATVNSSGQVSALHEGSFVLKAIYSTLEETQMTIEVKTNKIKPTAFNLTSNVKDEVIYIDTEIKLDFEVTPANASRSVIFETSDDRTAKVDKEGNVRFYKGGSVVITVKSTLNKSVSASITLTSLDYVNPIEFFKKYNVGTVAQQYCVNACWDRDPYPVTLLQGSISYYFFEPFEVVTSTAYAASPSNYSYGIRNATWFITVHDAGGVSSGRSLANYASGSARNEEKSWHYSVGSDGIFKGLDEDYGGWHAGDGSREVVWTDTGVEANPLEPHAQVSISEDQYWIVAGVKTDLKVTPTNPGATGCPSKFNNNHLPMTGINTRVGYNGNYLISSVWWSNSYKTLSNCGGNMNSIGMESEVGDSADLEVTWHHIAQLCADIIVRRNLVLGLDAICQHNTFSGKNCPQTMREAGRWGYFMKMAEAEYYAKKYLYDFSFELICNSELVDSRGQVTRFPESDTIITYQVMVTSAKYNFDQTTEPIEVIIPAKIAKPFVQS